MGGIFSLGGCLPHGRMHLHQALTKSPSGRDFPTASPGWDLQNGRAFLQHDTSCYYVRAQGNGSHVLLTANEN